MGESREPTVSIRDSITVPSSTLKVSRWLSASDHSGDRVTLASRKCGAIIRPLGDVVTLISAPAMPAELVRKLCQGAIESIKEATR